MQPNTRGRATLPILSYKTEAFTLRQCSTMFGELVRIRAAAAAAIPAILAGV
jgi:hypothetical protein